jgi:hypothetical protein
VAKSAATRNVLAASTTGVASENSGASGLPRSTDQCKAYAKRESVLVVTVGTLDATAWLTATGTPDSPMPVLTQPQACPPRLGLFANQLELAAPGYVRREKCRYFAPAGPGKAASSV